MGEKKKRKKKKRKKRKKKKKRRRRRRYPPKTKTETVDKSEKLKVEARDRRKGSNFLRKH